MIHRELVAAIIGCLLAEGLCSVHARARDQQIIPPTGEKKGVLGDAIPKDAINRLGTLRFRDATTIWAMALSPDGRHLLTGGQSGTIRLSDAETGEAICDLAHETLYPYAFAFSPDGKHMAGGRDSLGRLFLWDTKTRKVKRLVPDGEARPTTTYSVAFSPDGKLLASGTAGSLELWDVERAALVERFPVYHAGPVNGVAFSPDGKLLASCGGQPFVHGHVYLWDVGKKEKVAELQGVRDNVNGLAFSPDGKTLATAGHDKRVLLWDVRTRELVHKLDVDTLVKSVTFSKDGKYLASGGGVQIRLWDPKGWQEVRRIACTSGSMGSITFTPDGKTLYASGTDNAVRRWDVATGDAIRAAPGHETTVQTVRFAPDGSLASLGSNDQLHLWDAKTGKELRCLTLSLGQSSGADELRYGERPFVFSPDGKTVFARSHDPDEPIQGWDVTTGKKRFSFFAKERRLYGFDLSPDGTTVAATCHDHIRLWSVEERKEIPPIGAALPGQRSPVSGTPILFLPDGRTLVSNRGVEVLFVDREAGTSRASLAVQKAKTVKPDDLPVHTMRRIVLSADKRLLAGVEGTQSDRETNAVFVWEIATGTMLSRFTVAAAKGKGTAELHDGRICTVAFSPDGRLLATAGLLDKTVRLWDVRTGKHLHCFKGHDGGVTSVDFHPDGKTLASGSTDTTILLWDVSKYYPSAGDAPTPEKLPALWDDLASADPHTAFKAADALVAARDKSVTLLAASLQPVAKPDATTIQRLLDDLEARDFKVREKAAQELARLGPVVEAELRRKLKDRPSLDLERRLQALLRDMRPWIRDPDTLRAVRAVAVLERLGSPDAAALLKKLAAGAEAATLTREARAAVDRHRRLQRR